MAKYSKGVYTLKNPKKYVGKVSPTYRSSWEHKVFVYLDENVNIINWASEPIAIPYYSHVDGKSHQYYPDILVKYLDKTGVDHVELWEIKPKNQTFLEEAKSKKDRIAFETNICKWQQAEAWCKSRGITFRVLTELDLFGVPRKK